jgi:hypothetical protein
MNSKANQLDLAKALAEFFEFSFNREWKDLPQGCQESWLEIAKDFQERIELNVDKDKQNYLDLIEASEKVWKALSVSVTLEPTIYQLSKVLKKIEQENDNG